MMRPSIAAPVAVLLSSAVGVVNSAPQQQPQQPLIEAAWLIYECKSPEAGAANWAINPSWNICMAALGQPTGVPGQCCIYVEIDNPGGQMFQDFKSGCWDNGEFLPHTNKSFCGC